MGRSITTAPRVETILDRTTSGTGHAAPWIADFMLDPEEQIHDMHEIANLTTEEGVLLQEISIREQV